MPVTLVHERNPAYKALSHTDITGKLTPHEIDRMIYEELRAENYIRENCPRKADQRGEAYRVNRRSARPAPEWIADTGTFTAVESTYDATTEFPFKTLGVRLEITRKAQAEGRGLVDLAAEEVEAAAKALRQEEEDCFLNGNVGTNALKFSGLNTVLNNAAYITSMGTNGGALTAAKLDEAVDETHGSQQGLNGAMLCHYRTGREIAAVLAAKQRYNDRAEVRGGFRVRAYDDVPIFPTERESITRTQGTSSVASNLYIVTWDSVFYGVLTELQTYTMAQVTSQYMAFEIVEDLVLVISNRKRARILQGIIPPS